MRSIKEIRRIRQYLRTEPAPVERRGKGRSAGNSMSTGFMASLSFLEDASDDLVQRWILDANIEHRVPVEYGAQERRHSCPLDLQGRHRAIELDHLAVALQARRRRFAGELKRDQLGS